MKIKDSLPVVEGQVYGTLTINERRGSTDYDKLTNKPTLNGVTIEGEKTAEDYGISFTGSYDALTDKPILNGVTMEGNKTSADYNIEEVSEVSNFDIQDILDS